MLISFTVENHLSYKERTTFSLVASREKNHSETLIQHPGYPRLLPLSAIYGGNASGKSNFCKALWFARNLVVQGTPPDVRIAVEPFALDSSCATQPSTFIFELQTGGKCYEYGFSVSRQRVEEEWLIEILKTTENELFRRKEGKISLAPALKKNRNFSFLFAGTRPNQLFLTNAVDQNNERFRPIYLWFREQLIFITPESKFGPFSLFLEDQNPLADFANTTLADLDTGIVRLGGEPVPLHLVDLPPEVMEDLTTWLDQQPGQQLQLQTPEGERFVISVDDSESGMKVEKLVSYHQMNDANGTEKKFDLRKESDGTRRLLDILPVFKGERGSAGGREEPRVYIIDELDRNLHSLLVQRLLEGFLDERSAEGRVQIIFTTHNLLLMEQNLLRRDEMWGTERDGMGSTSLFAFSDYKEIRKDKDIRKSYLQGRLGGIPRLTMRRRKSAQKADAEG